MSDTALMMAAFYEAMFCSARSPDRLASSESGLPILLSGVRVVEFSFNPYEVIERLRSKQSLDAFCYRQTYAAFQANGENSVAHWELSSLLAVVLRLCNGRTSMAEMASRLGVPGEAAVKFLAGQLEQLSARGLVRFSSTRERTAGLTV